jgi:hypothetical protein
MYARNVTLHLKANSAGSLPDAGDGCPPCSEANGFKDELAFVAANGAEAVAISMGIARGADVWLHLSAVLKAERWLNTPVNLRSTKRPSTRSQRGLEPLASVRSSGLLEGAAKSPHSSRMKGAGIC